MERHQRKFRCSSPLAHWAAVLAGVLSIAPTAVRANPAQVPEQIGFSKAIDVLRSAGDHAYAIEMLQQIARQGDARAQVLLASLYIEGKELPNDPVLAQAWLQVATSDQSYFVEDTLHWAQDISLANGARLTGPQLIAAEALSSRMLLERAQSQDNGIREALRARYTTAEPILFRGSIRFPEKITVRVPDVAGESPLFKPGYAMTEADSSPSQAATGDSARRCTGEIDVYDKAPSLVRDPGNQKAPKYPSSARRSGVEGQAIVLLHLDRSGKVCGASIASSSGSTLLDIAAIDDMRGRRFDPALRAGQPTESFVTFTLRFRIAGYTFRP